MHLFATDLWLRNYCIQFGACGFRGKLLAEWP